MPQAFSDSIVAALPDAVITIDRTSTILDVNEAAMRLFGYPREAFVGRTLAETIIPADLASQHARGMEKHAATGHGPVIGRRVEITARDRSDRRFPIELCVFVNPERPCLVRLLLSLRRRHRHQNRHRQRLRSGRCPHLR